jgi:hypothetical protein
MASPLIKMTRKFKWAYAMYRAEMNEGHAHDHNRYDRIRKLADDVNMPTHIKTEFIAMAEELKKQWECPICCEFIKEGELDVTSCGHKFCKDCLVALKARPEKQCAICRRELRS